MGASTRPRGTRAARRSGAVLVTVFGIVFFIAASSGPAPVTGSIQAESAHTPASAPTVPVADWGALEAFLAPQPRLRVGILPDASGVSISSDAGVVVLPLGENGTPEGHGYALSRASFVPASASVGLRLLESASELRSAAVVPAMPSETLYADGAPYRGYLEVRAGEGTLSVVNVVNIEDYLRGVLPNELSPAPGPALEAMKAQAVAARTYALRQRGDYAAKGYDLCATPACQVYGGRATEHQRADRAVAETRGLVAQYDGLPIKALYTSACGGHTEDVEEVFVGERERPYLRGVVCASERSAGGGEPSLARDAALAEALDAIEPNVASATAVGPETPTRSWQMSLSRGDVARAVSRYGALSDVRDVQLRRVGASGRVLEVAVIGRGEELVLKGLEVRRGLGLPENLFVMDRDTDARGAVRRFVFTGKGSGHGVGLCQAGAMGMARAGAGFEQILTHYYTGVTLRKAY